jgi:hypothetical protein
MNTALYGVMNENCIICIKISNDLLGQALIFPAVGVTQISRKSAHENV